MTNGRVVENWCAESEVGRDSQGQVVGTSYHLVCSIGSCCLRLGWVRIEHRGHQEGHKLTDGAGEIVEKQIGRV
jgi:hypothetical protein